jgi:glucosamine-6-phosphate deaminase
VKFDHLAVEVFASRQRMGAAAAEAVAAIIRGCEEPRVIFACAPSQNEFLAALVEQPLDWSRVTAFHMDEYVGLNAAQPQSFRCYLRGHLLDQVGPLRAFHAIRGEAEDLDGECERCAQLLREKPIDLVCLGIGENGHLAFNDPPVADFVDPKLIKKVELDLACREQQVHDGCFPTLNAVPRSALTLTIPALLSARHVSCVVPGERKANAVRDALLGPISTACPASALRTHPRAQLHLDSAAARLLASDA